MQKKLVVVGGGYVGFEVAKALDSHAEVTLIEQREAFVHPPAAIRALVDQSLLEQIVLPYDNLLSHGRVIRARVDQVGPDGVTLADGTEIAADWIVVATGSSYAAPFKPAGETVQDFLVASRKVSADLRVAQSVAIVGAGAVGTELAGEIATAYPDKTVTLISSQQTLFPMYPAKLGRALVTKLKKLGVAVVLGQRAQDLQRADMPYAGTLTLTDGRAISADLIFPVVGSRPQSALVEGLAGAQAGPSGRVQTDPWLRPSEHANIFVAGDVAETGDNMTIVATARQNPWLIKTLKAAIKGQSIEDQKPYSAWKKAPILLPLGPTTGSSWIFATLGNWVTSVTKGREIFIPKYRKAFGISGRSSTR